MNTLTKRTNANQFNVCAMVQADMKEDDYELSAAYKKILDERIAAHEATPSPGSSWEEVKTRIRSQL